MPKGMSWHCAAAVQDGVLTVGRDGKVSLLNGTKSRWEIVGMIDEEIFSNFMALGCARQAYGSRGGVLVAILARSIQKMNSRSSEVLVYYFDEGTRKLEKVKKKSPFYTDAIDLSMVAYTNTTALVHLVSQVHTPKCESAKCIVLCFKTQDFIVSLCIVLRKQWLQMEWWPLGWNLRMSNKSCFEFLHNVLKQHLSWIMQYCED